MVQYVDVTVEDHSVRVEIREEPGWNITYAAQVSCPYTNCESFYNTTKRSTPAGAKNAVVSSLRQHLRGKKHQTQQTVPLELASSGTVTTPLTERTV